MDFKQIKYFWKIKVSNSSFGSTKDKTWCWTYTESESETSVLNSETVSSGLNNVVIEQIVWRRDGFEILEMRKWKYLTIIAVFCQREQMDKMPSWNHSQAMWLEDKICWWDDWAP